MIAGIGIDIVDLERMRRALARHGERFLRRVFTEGELEFCRRRHDPVPCYAARFAAKEAFFKALATGWAAGIRWHDVEVRRAEGRAPELAISGRAGEIAGELGVRRALISLSHSEGAAVALVLLEK
jgi:holo-[acyl-carrier protein] synthase